MDGVRLHWVEAGEASELPTVVLLHGLNNSCLHRLLLLECPKRVRRLVLVASGGLGRDVGFSLRLASLPHLVEHFGQPFMAIGTRLALRSVRQGITREDVARLSCLNAQPGSARAFARSVRDVVDWRGQRRHFLHRADEIETLPAVLVLWGDRDPVIPVPQGRAFSALLDGAVFQIFEGCGHYLHNEQPAQFARIVRDFLDDPAVPNAQLKTRSAPHSAARPRRWGYGFIRRSLK